MLNKKCCLAVAGSTCKLQNGWLLEFPLTKKEFNQNIANTVWKFLFFLQYLYYKYKQYKY